MDTAMRALERAATHSIPALIRLAEALDRAGKIRRPAPLRGRVFVEGRRWNLDAPWHTAFDRRESRDREHFATFPNGWTRPWTVAAIEGLLVNAMPVARGITLPDVRGLTELARAILYDGPHSDDKRRSEWAAVRARRA